MTHKLKLWFKKLGWYLAGETPNDESLEAYEAFKDMYPKLRTHKRRVCADGDIITSWGIPDDEHVQIRFAKHGLLVLEIREGPKLAVALFPADQLLGFLEPHHVTNDVIKEVV